MRVLCFVRVLCCIIWKFSCSVCECGLKRNRTDLNSDVGFLEKQHVALHVVQKTLQDILSLADPTFYEKEPRHVLIASCNQTSTRLCVHHNSVIHKNLSVGHCLGHDSDKNKCILKRFSFGYNQDDRPKSDPRFDGAHRHKNIHGRTPSLGLVHRA